MLGSSANGTQPVKPLRSIGSVIMGPYWRATVRDSVALAASAPLLPREGPVVSGAVAARP